MTPNWLVNCIWNWEELCVHYEDPEGMAYFGLPWEQWLWPARGDPGRLPGEWPWVMSLLWAGRLFTRVAPPPAWPGSPLLAHELLDWRLPSRRNAAWHCPAGLRPASSWADWCHHGPWSSWEAEPTDGSKKSAWCQTGGWLSPLSRSGRIKIGALHFDPSVQASPHPSSLAQGEEMTLEGHRTSI